MSYKCCYTRRLFDHHPRPDFQQQRGLGSPVVILEAPESCDEVIAELLESRFQGSLAIGWVLKLLSTGGVQWKD